MLLYCTALYVGLRTNVFSSSTPKGLIDLPTDQFVQRAVIHRWRGVLNKVGQIIGQKVRAEGHTDGLGQGGSSSGRHGDRKLGVRVVSCDGCWLLHDQPLLLKMGKKRSNARG